MGISRSDRTGRIERPKRGAEPWGFWDADTVRAPVAPAGEEVFGAFLAATPSTYLRALERP